MSWLRWKSPYDAKVVVLPTEDTFVPVKIDENDLYTGVLELLKHLRPNWTQEDIKLKTLTNGITNKLVSCQFLKSSDEKDIVLVRIYGKKTDLFIDRTAEIRNIKMMNIYRMAPKIYGIFENGLAYQYFPGKTMDIKGCYSAKTIWACVASKMADMHRIELGKDVPKEPFVWDKIEQFLSLLPDPFTSEIKQARFAKSFGSVTKLRIEYERLKFHLIKTESPIVFAHNDLLLGNIIYNKNDEDNPINFIDFEYAAYCYQAYDIANHFNEYVGLSIDDIDYENYPCRDYQKEWIKAYLGRYMEVACPCSGDILRVLNDVEQLSLVSHFLWGIWSLVQYEHSEIDFDFCRYAEIRLNRYNELKCPIFSKLST